jgi:hypothetical protein
MGHTLLELDHLVKKFADARQDLNSRVQALNHAVEQVKRSAMNGIKSAIEKTAFAKMEVRDAIEESPELFVRPKTFILHNIKVGMNKVKDSLEFDDEESVVKAIKRHLPEQAEILIRTEERVNKKSLESLSPADLKRIGVHFLEGTDVPVIKATDGSIDKLVNGYLKDLEKSGDDDIKEAA